MKTHHCPDHIAALFKHEDQRQEAQRLALEWLGSVEMQMGDAIVMPNLATGAMEKTLVTEPCGKPIAVRVSIPQS